MKKTSFAIFITFSCISFAINAGEKKRKAESLISKNPQKKPKIDTVKLLIQKNQKLKSKNQKLKSKFIKTCSAVTRDLVICIKESKKSTTPLADIISKLSAKTQAIINWKIAKKFLETENNMLPHPKPSSSKTTR